MISVKKPIYLREAFLAAKKVYGIRQKPLIRKHFRFLKQQKLIIFDRKTDKYRLPDNWTSVPYIDKLDATLGISENYKYFMDFFSALCYALPKEQAIKIAASMGLSAAGQKVSAKHELKEMSKLAFKAAVFELAREDRTISDETRTLMNIILKSHSIPKHYVTPIEWLEGVLDKRGETHGRIQHP